MSSLLAHVAFGLTPYFCQCKSQAARLRVSGLTIVLPVLLAILPDFDYFAIWFLHLRFAQRYTHSLLFCCMAALIACGLVRSLHGSSRLVPGLWILLLASCSHLLLDLLAGRFLPLLWPFVNEEFSVAVVLLPGAAHTGLATYVFWRNLIVESCLLLPMLVAVVMLARRLPWRAYLPEILLVLGMWSGLAFAAGKLLTP